MINLPFFPYFFEEKSYSTCSTKAWSSRLVANSFLVLWMSATRTLGVIDNLKSSQKLTVLASLKNLRVLTTNNKISNLYAAPKVCNSTLLQNLFIERSVIDIHLLIDELRSEITFLNCFVSILEAVSKYPGKLNTFLYFPSRVFDRDVCQFVFKSNNLDDVHLKSIQLYANTYTSLYGLNITFGIID